MIDGPAHIGETFRALCSRELRTDRVFRRPSERNELVARQ